MGRATSSIVHEYADEEILAAVELHGGVNKAALALGVPKTSFKRRLKAIQGTTFREMKLAEPVAMTPPPKGVRRWIFSSAQCNSAIDENFLSALEVYAKEMNATIHISGFTYNINPYGTQKKGEPLEYHPRVRPYLTNTSFEIDGKLVFCGEMDTLPTAVNPLSGFQTYTREKWGLLPHPKFVLESVPVRMCDPPKLIMTTGAVTKPNYIMKKAGIKAAFHHVIGAVVVEIDKDGDFFVRQLSAANDGSFHDLDKRFTPHGVVHNSPVEAITWGDIHVEHLDPAVEDGAWSAEGCMLDTLLPQYQVFHDVLDFRRRNHHAIKDPHHWFKMWVDSRESVEDEVMEAAEFLLYTYRPGCKSVVIDSNHDRALERWLKEANVKYDPANAEFWLKAQAAYYRALRRRQDFLLFQWAIEQTRVIPDDAEIEFVSDTEPFMIGDIEYGMHGHKGANGGRGHIKTFARMGPKANVAHTHHAAVYEGIYQAGHSCKRDVEYNRGGLTSWNQSHIVTYPNGKRTIVTMRGDKWRA